MTPLNKTVQRVTVEEYGYGNNRRKLVAAFERGDLITIREPCRHTKDTARIVDVLWWMKRSKAAKIQMEKLRERKAAKAARLAAQRQRRHAAFVSRITRPLLLAVKPARPIMAASVSIM